MCDPDKVATAVHIERPDTKSKLRKFLGAVGWFRMWIADFALMQFPLNDLLKGEEPEKKKFTCAVRRMPRARAESGGRWVEHAVARLHRLACAEGACLL